MATWALARNIKALEIVWFSKYARKTARTPTITKYNYTHQESEWRQFLLDPKERGKRD